MPRPELSTLRYPNLWQGCVGAWCPSQSGATGYRLFDDSGNNNHGVLSGVDPGTDWMPSQNRLAIDFDGVDDYALATIPTIFLQQGFVTFNFWAVNPSGGNWLCALSNNSNINTWFGLNIGANLVLFNRTDVGGDSTVSSSRIPGNYSTWRMITCISTPTNFAIYQNGILGANTNRTLGTETTLNRIAIGALYRGSLGPVGYTQSQFDDIRVYNRALTNSEIQQLYSGGRGAAYERSRGRKKAYVPGYRITAPSRIQTGSARTIDGTDTESLSRGLVGAWCPSLGASGFRLIDRSGNNNHGTLTNMDPGTDWVPSGGKLALDFDGSNDYVISNSPVLQYPFSVAYWMQCPVMSNTYAIHIGNEGSTADRFIHGFIFDGANWKSNGRIFVGGQLLSFELGNFGPTFPTTYMHQVTVWRDTNNREQFVNGISVGTNTTNITQFPSLSRVFFGSHPLEGVRKLTGVLDDVRIYNRALTPSEIRLLYTGGRGVGLLPEAKPKRARIVAWDNQDKISVPARVLTNTDSLKRGLVGHWSPSVSGPQGNRLMDLSGQNNHGTLTNMDYQTDYVPSAEKGGRMALDFDGVNDYTTSQGPNIENKTVVSLCSWIFRPASGTLQTFGYGTTAQKRVSVLWFSDNRIYCQVESGSTTSYPNALVNVTGWQHVCMAFDGSLAAANRIILYVNGVFTPLTFGGSDPGTVTQNNIGPFEIGREFANSRYSTGMYDDVRIYNRALTPSEIRLLAQSRMPERATPQRTRTVFYSSGLVSYLRRRTYNSILGSGVLS